jgi:hypothetical protein
MEVKTMELRKISNVLGVLLLLVGLIVSLLGYNNTVSAPWQSSMFYNGLTQLLFGISVLIAGNGIINLKESVKSK